MYILLAGFDKNLPKMSAITTQPTSRLITTERVELVELEVPETEESRGYDDGLAALANTDFLQVQQQMEVDIQGVYNQDSGLFILS